MPSPHTHRPRKQLSAPMDTLAAAAAVAAEPGSTGAGERKAAANPGAGEGAAGSGGSWEFPVYVGHRRPLPPDDVLFEAGNIEREQLARQAAVAVARDERLQLSKEAGLAGTADVAGRLGATFECGQCHVSLPTARLLELHVAELHDSFFAAQAARRMPVYLCLVEGCPRKFCTVEERKQHLTDHHKFPRNFHFDRIHLRRRKAQIRPLPQFRKGGHGRQSMATDAPAAATGAEEGAGAGAAPQAQGQAAAAAGAGPAEGHATNADAVVHGMSRLSMAAETSTMPSVIHFGRGRGRGLAGVRFGRGAGGVKAPARGASGSAPGAAAGEALGAAAPPPAGADS